VFERKAAYAYAEAYKCSAEDDVRGQNGRNRVRSARREGAADESEHDAEDRGDCQTFCFHDGSSRDWIIGFLIDHDFIE
jgi:hypothetical protein